MSRTFIAVLIVAPLLALSGAERSTTPPFSAELDVYPIHPSAVQSTVDEIHARTVTSANQVSARSPPAANKSSRCTVRSASIRRSIVMLSASSCPNDLSGDTDVIRSVDGGHCSAANTISTANQYRDREFAEAVGKTKLPRDQDVRR